jgi:GNAT superfamily N-acetyltransferase
MNMLKICEVNDLEVILNKELRSRAERARNRRTTEFLAVDKDVEVALIVYEDWSEKSLGFIYEVYVLPAFRKNGFGVDLLTFAYSRAEELGCKTIELNARPFDQSIKQEWLYSWYEKNGYVKVNEDSERMELHILKQ